MMNGNNWEVITSHKCLLAEGPVWDNIQKRIFWVDILKGDIHCFYPGTAQFKTFNAGQMVGAVALRRSGGLIAALRAGFATIDPDRETVELIAKVESHLSDNRFNDGKCDPAGRFWAGTMSTLNTQHAGSLYALEKNFAVSVKITDISCSNGMAWSPDHQTFYYIDTPTGKIVCYDYDITNGSIRNPRTVIHVSGEEGYPDGMTIDTEGMLWIALWDGWKVIRCDPYTGNRLGEVNLPVSRVSSCVFGGDAMEDLYITSAGTGLSASELVEQPLAGSLFVIKNCGFKGIEAVEFDG